jgi:NitT/TauT family transport system substrate-binding protein
MLSTHSAGPARAHPAARSIPLLLRGTVAAAFLAAAATAAMAAEKVTFMIDWLPAGDKAVPYLGVQKGLFAAEGLEVTIQSGRGSSDVVTKLATGSVDMGTGGLAALLQAKAQR